MKATLESTTKKVFLNGVECRVREGRTENGTPFHCYIVRVAVANSVGIEGQKEFERDLLEQAAPSPEIQAIPLRMIL